MSNYDPTFEFHQTGHLRSKYQICITYKNLNSPDICCQGSGDVFTCIRLFIIVKYAEQIISKSVGHDGQRHTSHNPTHEALSGSASATVAGWDKLDQPTRLWRGMFYSGEFQI